MAVWDPKKAKANLLKHGVRFSDAEGALVANRLDSLRRGARRKRNDINMRKEYDFSGGRQGAVVKHPGKTRITIFLDDDVLQAFRERADASGIGYQTMINEALRGYLGKSAQPLDARTLRRILREELRRTG